MGDRVLCITTSFQGRFAGLPAPCRRFYLHTPSFANRIVGSSRVGEASPMMPCMTRCASPSVSCS